MKENEKRDEHGAENPKDEAPKPVKPQPLDGESELPPTNPGDVPGPGKGP